MDDRPRVIIDALAARFGGAAYASIELAERIARDAEGTSVVVVSRANSIVARSQKDGPEHILLPDARRFELARRLTWEARSLPALLADPASSVLTWSGMLPRTVTGRIVCYLANPPVFQDDDLGNRLRRWAVRRTAAAAEHVVAPTAGMADLAAPALGRRPDVVPLGIDHNRFRPGAPGGQDLLCVADFYPHKRYDVALAAWTALPAPRPRLRIIGDPGSHPANSTAVKQAAERHRELGEISVESGLAEDEMVAAYHGARALLVTSERESFSMPLLEALACGLPAVARDVPSLRETGGPGTSYVSGDSPVAWARAINGLFRDDARHGEAREAGIEHARSYSWERTATELAVRLMSQ